MGPRISQITTTICFCICKTFFPANLLLAKCSLIRSVVSIGYWLCHPKIGRLLRNVFYSYRATAVILQEIDRCSNQITKNINIYKSLNLSKLRQIL